MTSQGRSRAGASLLNNNPYAAVAGSLSTDAGRPETVVKPPRRGPAVCSLAIGRNVLPIGGARLPGPVVAGGFFAGNGHVGGSRLLGSWGAGPSARR